MNIEEHYNGIIKKQRDKINLLDPFERGDVDSIPEDDLINVLHKDICCTER